MIDLDTYYASDHKGRKRLLDIAKYGLLQQGPLTKAECLFAFDYYEKVIQLVEDRTLHLQENSEWDDLNYRYGWRSVRGTQAEFLSVIIWNHFNTNTQFRLRASSKDEQMSGLDVAVVNPKWRCDYVGQVKELFRGDNPNQLKIKDDYLQYDPNYVDRLILIDIDNLTLYNFNYEEFLSHYSTCEKYNHGFIDDNFSSMKYFHKFTLPAERLREHVDSIVLNR